jgi:tetratricopeptide (TPR) repeat protein
MNWPTFHDLVRTGRFFDQLGAMPAADFRALLPWLRLLRTEAIEDWARRSPRVQRSARARGHEGQHVLQLLLERHLLHLATRRDPSRLGDFWRWATPRLTAFADCWEEADLPATLEPLDIRTQEENFACVLDAQADRMAGTPALAWAVEVLRRLADRRAANGRPHQGSACARVVFGWQGTPPPDLRPGLVVDFRLLAEAGAQVVITAPEAFDATFLDALRLVPDRIGLALFRRLEHDEAFLGRGVLRGSSGTMAVWLAQWLAACGRFAEGCRWGVPPWVVVTATLDPDGAGAGGAAGSVGLLREKAALLVEEGVRVMVVADPEAGDATDATAQRYADEPGAEDLRVHTVRGDVLDLADGLHRRRYLWPVELQALEGALFESVDPRSGRERQQRRKARQRPLRFNLREDYLEPAHALEALERARGKLPGRGYLWLTAPPATGKSVLVQALRERWPGADRLPGRTLGYAVLHGRSENPTFFLQDVVDQAAHLDPDEPLHGLPQPHITQGKTLEQVRAELLGVLRLAKELACAGRPLLLAVDGLDELAAGPGDRPELLDLLPRPDELPAGCYVLLTSRPEVRPGVRQALMRWQEASPTYFGTVPLTLDDPRYHDLLARYLRRSLGYGLLDEVVQGLLAKARYQFLYVRFLRDLLAGQEGPPRAADLPEASALLPAYLGQLAERVAGGPEVFARWHRPLLLLLAAAYEPVTQAHLRLWLGEQMRAADAVYRLEMALEELGALLREERPAQLFAVGHQEVLDWLRTTDHPDWRDALRREGHLRLAEAARRLGVPAVVVEGKVVPRHDPGYYHLLHVPSHWLDGGDAKAAWGCLDAAPWRAEWDRVQQTCMDQWGWAEMVESCTHYAAQLGRLGEAVSAGRLRVREGDEFEMVNDLARAHMNRGNTSTSQQRYGEALADYGRAIALRRQLVAALGGDGPASRTHPALVNDLALAYVNRGLTRNALRQFEEARADYSRGIELFEHIVQGVRQYALRNLLWALWQRIALADSQGDAEDLVSDVRRAVAWVLTTYQAVGAQVRLPDVCKEFARLDSRVTRLEASGVAVLAEEERPRWDELRRLLR